MKTPDKIFVSSDPFGFMSGYYMENHPPHGEEYIRKDYLLALLREQKKQKRGIGMISWGMRTAIGQMIDKINNI